MADQKIEWVQECDKCHGTGLYIGIAENGAASVCTRCDGTGRWERAFEFNEFTGRKTRDGIRHVYAQGGRIKLDPDVVPGGISYEEWLNDPESVNAPGHEIRGHTCPAGYYQGSPHGEMPNWDTCRTLLAGSAFTHCQYYGTKNKCWERWDAECRPKP